VAPKELGILILLLHRLPVVPTIRLPSNSQQLAPEMAGKVWEMAGKVGK